MVGDAIVERGDEADDIEMIAVEGEGDGCNRLIERQ
jgi:hypothetical protein